MATIQSTVRSILGAQTNSRSVRAEAIYSLIKDKNEEEQTDLLSICFEERDSVKRNNGNLTNHGISELEWSAFVKSHSPVIVAHLKQVFFKIRTKEEFAKQVIKLINFYDTDKEKVFCIAVTLYSEFIPFHELPGERISVDTERFSHLLEVNQDKKDLIEYIIRIPFFYTTDEASHILFLLDDLDGNQELRVSLLAYYMAKKERVIKDYYSK